MSAAAPDPDADFLDDGVKEIDARAAERLAHPIRLQKLQAVPVEQAPVRRCDGCGRRPRARAGCYALLEVGFARMEICRRCLALLRRVVDEAGRVGEATW